MLLSPSPSSTPSLALFISLRFLIIQLCTICIVSIRSPNIYNFNFTTSSCALLELLFAFVLKKKKRGTLAIFSRADSPLRLFYYVYSCIYTRPFPHPSSRSLPLAGTLICFSPAAYLHYIEPSPPIFILDAISSPLAIFALPSSFSRAEIRDTPWLVE